MSAEELSKNSLPLEEGSMHDNEELSDRDTAKAYPYPVPPPPAPYYPGPLAPDVYQPSFLHCVLEFDSANAFPPIAKMGKIYIARDTNKIYRWNGRNYEELSQGGEGGDSLEQVQASWTETDSSSKAYIKNKPSLAAVATTGSYNDLSNKPEIPELPTLAAVATTGNYEDLEGKPTIPELPELATVATTGSYNDLSDKPTIPEVLEQVQADWNEADEESKAFIKNKPQIPDTNLIPEFHQDWDIDPETYHDKPIKIEWTDDGWVACVWEQVGSEKIGEASDTELSWEGDDSWAGEVGLTATREPMSHWNLSISEKDGHEIQIEYGEYGWCPIEIVPLTSGKDDLYSAQVTWTVADLITAEPGDTTITATRAVLGYYLPGQRNKPLAYMYHEHNHLTNRVGKYMGAFLDENGRIVFYDGEEFNEQTAWKSEIPEVPTNVSAFTNDAGYVTSDNLPDVPTKTSDLTNDSDFVASSNVVHNTGNEEVFGQKTFNDGIKVDSAQEFLMGNTNLKAYLEEAFSYRAITVDTFNVKNGNASTFLYGTSIDKLSFDWTLSKSANTITITGNNLTTLNPTTSPQNDIALTSALNPAIGSNASTTYTYTIAATENEVAGHPNPVTATKNATITFCNVIKTGASSSTTATQELIAGLATDRLNGNKNTTYTVNAGSGQYIWIAYPKRLGKSKFTIGGFEGGFEEVQTVSFTNAKNVTEDYYAYRTTQASLGNTSFVVTNA